jgi:hypothetical protein
LVSLFVITIWSNDELAVFFSLQTTTVRFVFDNEALVCNLHIFYSRKINIEECVNSDQCYSVKIRDIVGSENQRLATISHLGLLQRDECPKIVPTSL